MSRRRLRVVSSSSDEDDYFNQQRPQQPQHHHQDDNDVVFEDAFVEHQHQHQQQEEREDFEEEIENPSEDPIPNISSVTLNSTTTTTTATTAAVEISDDDFIDVAENLSPPSPPPVLSTTETVTITPPFVASDCPVNDHLRKLGLCLKREWLNSCQLGLENSVAGLGNLDVESKAKLCFGQFLYLDMNFVGAGVLPDDICGLHLVDLPGPFVLQVDEVVNISCPLRERYKNAAPGLKRCLKLSMTDGVQRVFGMEYRPIKSLEALATAGFKVAIRNVNVRRGLLMLVPEALEVLGGSVEELEAARQRLVNEVNKPPRGKRTRTGIVPPLSTRATRAAWQQNGVTNDTAELNGANRVPTNTTSSTIRSSTHFNGNVQGIEPSRAGIVPPLSTRATRAAWQQNGVTNNTIELNDANRVPTNTTSSTIHTSTHSIGNVEGTDTVTRSGQAPPAGRETSELPNMGGTHRNSIIGESGQYSVDREAAEHSISREATQHSISRENAQRSFTRETAQHSSSRETAEPFGHVEAHEIAANKEAFDLPPSRGSAEPSSFPTTIVENEDVHMVDYVEHPFILSRGKELPFTYLASLSAKWAAVQDREPFVQGKIKCIMTGVKRFQYRHRSTFELHAYVDDGSLISEILIHHNVVQQGIGYSPQEVTAAFSSSDMNVVAGMKNIFLQFQMFLTNFEGTMLVEMNATSDVPIALEMNEGCPASDAWLLLQRLKPATSDLLRQDGHSNVINLSP